MGKNFKDKLNSKNRTGLGSKNPSRGLTNRKNKKPKLSKNKKIKKSTGTKVRDFQKKRRADLIKNFSEKILDKYGKWIKSIVAWGSVVRDEFTGKSDIDVVVIVDDTREELDKKTRSKIDSFIKKSAKDVDEKLSPQPVWTITEFWDMSRTLSPLAYTLLKDGVPVYDTGFFAPIKRLLNMGKIPASKEAVEKRMKKVPKRLNRAKHSKLYMIAEDLYYAMLDSTQAVLMFLGRGPPDPNNAGEVARKYLVEKELLEEKYVDWLEDVIEFRKEVEHRNISSIKGKEVDKYIEKAEDYVEEMQKLLKRLELQKKASSIQKNYKVMVRASIAALKAIDKLPEDPKELPKAFKKELIDEDILNPVYENVFGKVLKYKKKLNDKDINDISERDINSTREYVRRFVGEVRKLLKEKDVSMEKMKELSPNLSKNK
ncbi:MAG: nucleotidyltransferase domain-containing protein, partial [Candidatus Aenigmatarchaeota archaeon]